MKNYNEKLDKFFHGTDFIMLLTEQLYLKKNGDDIKKVSNMQNCIQVFLSEDKSIGCGVNIDTLEVFSAKLKKLKGQTMPEHNMTYYMIKCNGKKKYIALDNLVAMAKKGKGI